MTAIDSWKKVAILFLIAGWLVYGNSLVNGFVGDDEDQIVKNLPLHDIRNAARFFQGSMFYSGGARTVTGNYYRPLVSVLWSAMYSTFGSGPFCFRFVQISLHITNSIFVFIVLRYFLSPLTSIFLSLVFLLHPINTESVIYISGFGDVLFFFWGILALACALKRNASLATNWLMAAFLLMSLLSKETGIAFVVLLSADVLLRRRGRKLLLYPCAAVISYFMLRFGLGHIYLNEAAVSPIMKAGITDRLLTMPKVFATYLTTFLFPRNLAFAQEWLVRSASLHDFWTPLAAGGLFCIAVGFLGNRLLGTSQMLRTLVFFLVWFGLGIGLHLQLVPADMTYADRYFYFPMVGLLGLFGLGMEQLPVSKEKVPLKSILGSVLLILLAGRTVARTFDFRSGYTLYTHDSRINTDSFALENDLGAELTRRGNYAAAEGHLKKSISLFPYFLNWNNLGVVYAKTGQPEKALAAFSESLKNAQFYVAYENIAGLFVWVKESDRAISFCQDALKRFPEDPKLWLYLALAEYENGDKKEAIWAARNAYAIDRSPESAYVVDRIVRNMDIVLRP